MLTDLDIVAMGYIFNENIRWPDGKLEGPYLGATVSYSAMALGRLGEKAGLVTVVGAETSRTLLQPLYDCGIDLQGVCYRAGATEIRNVLNYREDGTKVIEYLTRAPEIRFEDIPREYWNARLFHLALVDYDVPLDTIDAILRMNPNAIITADLGGAGGAHSAPEMRRRYIEADGGKLQQAYLERIRIGKASIEDAEWIFKRSFSTPADVAKAFVDAGVEMLVVTSGPQGAYICDRGGRNITVEAVTPYNGVVDTTGAGDTFIAAFVAEYLRTGDVERSAYFASATSSILIEQTGGVTIQRTPSRDKVEARLSQFFGNRGLSYPPATGDFFAQ